VEKYLPRVSSGRVETVVRTGSPEVEVCRFAAARGMDLMVLSTRGYTGLNA
jgi:nucleotide-binding universal stress UspA family protein